jgi:hypothetical protein
MSNTYSSYAQSTAAAAAAAALFDINICITLTLWAGIAQSVWQLATGWTIRGSNPVGGQDISHPSRPALGHTQPPKYGYRVFAGGKAAGAWR